MYTLLLTVLPTLLVPWQQATSDSQALDAMIDPAIVLGQTPAGQDVGLYYYRPAALDPDSIIRSVSPVHGRLTEYVDPSTGDDRMVENMRSFGELMVMVDTLDRIRLVVETIKGLERETRTAPDTAFRTLYYQPRYTSVSNLREALAPFDQQNIARANQWVPTIATINDGSALVIYNDAASITEIEMLLEKVDRPVPQVVLSAWVLLGGQQETTPLPDALSAELHRMLPYENYAQASLGLVRTAVKPGGRVRIDLRAQHSIYALDLSLGAYDEQTSALTFDSVAFTEDNMPRFQTATTVEAERYTVLGAAGSPPLFVVLRVSPAETPATGSERSVRGGR